MRRALRPCALAVISAWWIAGCVADGERDPSAVDAAAFFDSGGVRADEDAGASFDGAAVPRADGGELGEYDRAATGASDAYLACFNGDDEDGNGAADCADLSCRRNVPACCVGVSDDACCVAGAVEALPLAGCDGLVDTCPELVAMAEPFGSPRPQVGAGSESSERVFVPRGDTTDSGLVLRELIDPRTQIITLGARIGASDTPHASGADVISVGLVDAAAAGSLSVVAPRVAFSISGNRAEVSLQVAGEVVHREELTESGFADYALVVRPSGAITLLRGADTLATATLRIEAPVRVIVYGRTFNPDGRTDPVELASMSVRRDRCDVPSATSDGAMLFPSDPSWDAARRVAAPSVARWVDEGGATQERMALEIDGAIYLARAEGGAWSLATALGTPALEGGDAWATRLSDPALRWNGTTLELWFTGYDEGEQGSIARVLAPVGSESFAWADVERLLPGTESASYSEPAPLGTSTLALVERASRGEVLALFVSDGTTWTRSATLREPSGALAAFARDAVASPELVSSGGVQRLYFAGRRGQRWSIGVLVSPDGERWVEPQDGALVREPSGAGFDALGVRDPSVVIDEDTLRLFYTGLDGERARIGVALGAAPPR